MYKLQIQKIAQKQLQRIPTKDRERITSKIYALAMNPDNMVLDIKKLINEPGFRLRAGDWRVIFERNDGLKIISIKKVTSRGEAYK